MLGVSVLSHHAQICFHRVAHGNLALTQDLHMYMHIYMCVCVYMHTDYTRNYHSSAGISKASSLILRAAGTSGCSPISPGTVPGHSLQPVQGQVLA